MPLTTTEVPTFFGPSDSPLFGVLHLPVDNQIRGGVLICGSLGKEGMDSVRLHRILADRLARRGFGVLHFDYLGLGDSAYAQGRDDAVANWVASVGHALDYLTLIGAESVTAIGIRAGCLILDEYLAQSHANPTRSTARSTSIPLERAGVTFGNTPRCSGCRWARTLDARRSVNHRRAVERPRRRRIRRAADGCQSSQRPWRRQVLVVGRPAETDKRVTRPGVGRGSRFDHSGGLPECAQPLPIPLPIPVTAVDSIVEWIDENVPARTHRAVPQYLTTVTMPAEGPDGVDVVESIERIEPNGLFVIRTLPRHASPAPAKTVLFFVAANDLHVGPTREWVELSRRIAAAGSQAVRWDPAGQDLSGQIRRDPWRRVYSKADLTDSIAVARHACQDAGELELVGICSGAWYAAQAARNIGAQSAILVNRRPWNWRVTPTLLAQWYFRKKTLSANAASDTGGGRYRIQVDKAPQSTASAGIGSRQRALYTTTSRDTSCGC